MRTPRVRHLVALPLAGLLLASTVAAQEEPSPSASPEAEAVVGFDPTAGTWRRMAAAPFGAVDPTGGWTGTELVMADPAGKRRAMSYLPALDAWSDVAKPPRKLRAGSETHWTGTELVFVEPKGTAKRGLTLYDPVIDEWRATAAAPIDEIASSAFAGETLVAASATGARTATYDVETDTWTELPALEGATVRSLHSTGDDALALITLGQETTAFTRLDRDEGAWSEPSVAPLAPGSSPPLWIGDAFITLTEPAGDPAPEETAEAESPDAPAQADGSDAEVSPEDDAPTTVLDARYDPIRDAWTAIENVCAIDSTAAIWAEPLVLDVDRDVGFDPATAECFPLPVSPWADRTGALRVWTGNEVLDVSGNTGGAKPRRDGVAYDPYPGDDTLGVVLDEPSRAVRVQVPSLRIDLPVISDSRKVPGSTRGFPACDVALSWSAFDRPGKPGTAWILAHAQEGMFLPLLETLRARGKEALLGREVEVQLRDGRVLTYRTFRANGRATNANIGLKGRKEGEHRLVLQTSTGFGSDPKLVVAARLVDVGTTDEPRPKPEPRACG